MSGLRRGVRGIEWMIVERLVLDGRGVWCDGDVCEWCCDGFVGRGLYRSGN